MTASRMVQLVSRTCASGAIDRSFCEWLVRRCTALLGGTQLALFSSANQPFDSLCRSNSDASRRIFLARTYVGAETSETSE